MNNCMTKCELPLVRSRHWDKDEYETYDPANGAIVVDPRSIKSRGYFAPIIIKGNSVRMMVLDKTFVEVEGHDPMEMARKENRSANLSRRIMYESLGSYLFICHGCNPDDPKVVAFLQSHGMRRPEKPPTVEDLNALAMVALEQARHIFTSLCASTYPHQNFDIDQLWRANLAACERAERATKAPPLKAPPLPVLRKNPRPRP